MPESNPTESRYEARYIGRLLEACSPLNREDFKDYLEFLAGRHRSINTAKLAMGCLRTFDKLANGARVRDLAPAEWARLLAAFARTHRASSTQTFASYAKAFLTWANAGECPKGIKHALHVGKTKDALNLVLITEDERNALLRAAAKRKNRLSAARAQALVWLLWDSGFRASEALALRVGSVRFDADGGAHLALPSGAPDLKTGPRTIYVMDCVPALKVLIALHPFGTDPEAPLFCVRNTRDQLQRADLYRLLQDLCAGAGIRMLPPHLWRHSRCTRAAKGDPARGIAPWSNPQRCAYFGWEPGSEMADHYSHIAQRDMEETVRAEANADPLAARVRADPLGTLATLAGMVAAETIQKYEKAKAIDAGRRSDEGSPAPLVTA